MRFCSGTVERFETGLSYSGTQQAGLHQTMLTSCFSSISTKAPEVLECLTDLRPSSRASSTDSYRVPPNLEAGLPASALLLLAPSCCRLLAAAPEPAAQHSIHSTLCRANTMLPFHNPMMWSAQLQLPAVLSFSCLQYSTAERSMHSTGPGQVLSAADIPVLYRAVIPLLCMVADVMQLIVIRDVACR